MNHLGVLSTDTGIFQQEENYEPVQIEQNDPEYFDKLAKLSFSQGNSHKPEADNCRLYSCSKIVVVPQLNMALAGAGDMGFLFAVRECLSMQFYDDFTDFVDMAPGFFSGIAHCLPREILFHGALIGYSEKDKNVYAFQFGSADDFSLHSVHDRHGVHPFTTFDWEDPEFKPLRGSTDANRIEQLHVKMAKNQFQAYQAGKYNPGFHLGGQLQMAVVEPGRVTVKMVCPDISAA
jgi:hypothetical protein